MNMTLPFCHSLSPVALTPTVGVTHLTVCQAPSSPGRRAGRQMGDSFTGSIRHGAGFTFISANGGETVPRETPHLVAAIDAISNGQRALNMVFLRDGVIDEGEMAVIRAFRHAQALVLRADWNRRARQSIENRGSVNPRLMVEARELDDEFPLETA